MKMEPVIPVAEANPAKAQPVPPNSLSPQCIGREFVRCYYTLLHDNPDKLHRFYLDQSTFVHGNQTDETAECVSGQKAIHEKIMSLNFVDCYTKIKHVDSQPTIDNGVVVQVSGELSNAGKASRRFMQTFVLGSQTPRKYYVHNDIFRYQDEVFGCDPEDMVDDGDNSLSSQEDINENILDEEPAPIISEEQYFDDKPNGNIEDEVSLMNHNQEVNSEDVKMEPVDDAEEEVSDFSSEQDLQSFEETTSLSDTPENIYTPSPVLEKEVSPVKEEPKEEIPEEIPEPVPEVPKGPKSWAMIAGGGSAAAATPRVSQPAPAKSKPTPEPKEPPKKETSFQPFNKAEAVGDRSETRGGRRGRGENRSERGGFKSDRFQERDAPNSHQIFVGNLPSGISQKEIEERFVEYGKVVHVRITPNNFGFVVFESEDPVLKILGEVANDAKFYLKDQRLNIEEKKAHVGANRGGGGRKQFDQRGGGRGRSGGRRGGSNGRAGYNAEFNSDFK